MKVSKKKAVTVMLAGMWAFSLQAQSVLDSLDVEQLKVGYTRIDVRSIGGAVERVNVEQLKKGLMTSALDALSGQTAGVQVQTGGNQEAMVSAVRVRGTTSLTGGNDPLVIIDNVACDLAALSTIYPADIESFTILKDASETSQYGSRGAAGVIQVATKKGKEGRFQIYYDGNVGVESVYKKLNMLSADAYRQAARQMNVGFYDGGGSTNYNDVILRQGFVQNHHVAFGGGTESSNYRISTGIMDHWTVVRSNHLRNYIVKLDMTQKAFDDRVTFDIGTFGSIRQAAQIPFPGKLFYSASAFNPTIPNGRNAEGEFDQIPEAAWINNPNWLLWMDDDEDMGHFNGHLNAKANLGYGIQLKLLGSYSYNTVDNAHFYGYEAYRGDKKTEELLNNISLNKKFEFKNSSLSLMVLAERQQTKSKGFHVTTTDFSTSLFGYDNISAGAQRPWEGTGSFFTKSTMESFLFSAQYQLLDRYTISVNGRADGSSKVGKNNRWGYFPSLSTSWVIWEKDKAKTPLKGWKAFTNYIKLRVGYGLSGNLGGIDAYNSMQLMAPNGIISSKGTTKTSLAILRNANPDLKWEVKYTFNVGLNAAFWNQRIALTVDYYNSKVTDMLYMYDVPVPPFAFDKMLANLGSMSNSGVEVGFGITPYRSKDMEFTMNINMSFEHNKLISLDGYYNGQLLTAPKSSGLAAVSGAGFHGSSNVVSQVVGKPLGVFDLPHCTGLTVDEHGVRHYEVTKESYICGQATPKMRLGSNFAFRYRHCDIALQANGAFGHHIFNGTALTFMNMLSLPNYNVMEGAPEMNIQDQTISDYWLERGDYLNIDYITVGWTIPVKWRFVRNLRLSASVNNLCTITGYSGLTPMINSSVVNSTLGVDDKNTFPVYRTYSMGMSIQF